MSFADFIASMTNAGLAKALEYLGSQMPSGITDAILKEAAKRLRGDPAPCLAEPTPPDNPPLQGLAEIELAEDGPILVKALGDVVD